MHYRKIHERILLSYVESRFEKLRITKHSAAQISNLTSTQLFMNFSVINAEYYEFHLKNWKTFQNYSWVALHYEASSKTSSKKILYALHKNS